MGERESGRGRGRAGVCRGGRFEERYVTFVFRLGSVVMTNSGFELKK